MGGIEAKIYLLSVMALPFLLAVTLHEVGHALSAYWLGDNTAKMQGRLSLNPLAHVDPFGTVLLPLLALFGGVPFMIGYAKPVPINPTYFSNYRRDTIIVSLAGPFGNLVVGILCAYIVRLAFAAGFGPEDWIIKTMIFGIWLNAIFMVFNLLPIPPLDGSKVVSSFLPHHLAEKYERLAPFGFFILIGVILVAKDIIILPALWVSGMIAQIVGVPL